MNWSRQFTLVGVSLACWGLVLPVSVLEGSQPSNRASSVGPLAGDVELDRHGTLHGRVVNVQRVPVAGAMVVVADANREVARTSTDALGRFSVGGLAGGVYRLTIGGRASKFRVWVSRTAPPGASLAARIVIGEDVIRGQTPLGEFLTSDVVLISALVAAMIAVPVALHNADRSKPASP